MVDDDAVVRRVVSEMLQKLGFETLTASNGVDALVIYCKHHDDISAILLDMMMPAMDGETCFAELRKIDPDVKVILSSGYNEEEATNCFAGKGLAGFVQKPYTLKALRGKIYEVLG